MALQRHDDEAPPRVAWADFKPWFFKQWAQGEHVSLIGPTGGGKSTLAMEILPRRRNVVIFAAKPKDDTLARFIRDRGNPGGQYSLLREWPPAWNQDRVILWPKFRRMDDSAEQQRVFHQALGAIFTEESWCVYVDELSYLVEVLKLEPFILPYWKQGRSIRLSLVVATQRPAFVPLDAYSQATHLFFWRTNDERDLKRIGGVGWQSSKLIQRQVADLALHDVLYVNSRTGAMAVTRVEKGT